MATITTAGRLYLPGEMQEEARGHARTAARCPGESSECGQKRRYAGWALEHTVRSEVRLWVVLRCVRGHEMHEAVVI